MAKSKAIQWLEKDKLILLQGWARSGLTDEQIAHNMGIHVSTLYAYKLKFREIDDVLKKTKEVVDIQVENALLKNALDGNITAQIFWLKNRRKEQWREKQEVQVNTNPIEDLTPLAELLKGNNDKSNSNN